MFDKVNKIKLDLQNKIRSNVETRARELKKIPEKVLQNLFLTSLNIFNSALHEMILSRGLDPNRNPSEEKQTEVVTSAIKKVKSLAYTTGMPERKPFPKLKKQEHKDFESLFLNDCDRALLATKLHELEQVPACEEIPAAEVTTTTPVSEEKIVEITPEMIVASIKRKATKKVAAKKTAKKTKK